MAYETKVSPPIQVAVDELKRKITPDDILVNTAPSPVTGEAMTGQLGSQQKQLGKTKKRNRERQEQLVQQAKDFLTKWGKADSETASRQELATALKDLKAGSEASLEEPEFIMRMSAPKQDELSVQELSYAIDVWQSYNKLFAGQQNCFSMSFQGYDSNEDGKLEKKELHELMKNVMTRRKGRLNYIVNNQDINWLIEKANVHGGEAITLEELRFAMCAWHQKQVDK
eukprot:gnl/MRDRNA2_/MRDRNA2_74652_c0_seq1.p1 gnl/MRDRNA2_/MRDRNA2_74652_c0~~gnl/MRDRNA2_/MRDRNA2_74652_c0_seq1.p1  ORF type:complete len:227 (-),score=61.37 gnl/MRDRNA2_/MRDRNA2_74652_c0_seq1:296-976(-)